VHLININEATLADIYLSKEPFKIKLGSILKLLQALQVGISLLDEFNFLADDPTQCIENFILQDQVFFGTNFFSFLLLAL